MSEVPQDTHWLYDDDLTSRPGVDSGIAEQQSDTSGNFYYHHTRSQKTQSAPLKGSKKIDSDFVDFTNINFGDYIRANETIHN